MECQTFPIWDAILLGLAFAGVPLSLMGLAWFAEQIIPEPWVRRLFGDPYTGKEEE